MSDMPEQLPSVPQPSSRMAQAITDFIAQIPPSRVEPDTDPDAQARRIAASAAQRAALTAGSLALPPGPLGWLTVLPELVAIWKIQGQMVSDIATVYGKHAQLGREQMLWCLFRHTAAQAFRDLVVRLGDRMLFRRLSFGAMQHLAQRIGLRVSQRAVGKGLSRWLPIIGALGVGGYAYYDTGNVAKTAIELFNGVIDIDPPPGDDQDLGTGNAAKRRKTARATTQPSPTRETGGDARTAGARRRKAAGTRKRAANTRVASKSSTHGTSKTTTPVSPRKSVKPPKPSASTHVKAKPAGNRPRQRP